MTQQEYTQPPLSDEICEAVALGTVLGSSLALDAARGLLTEDCFTNAKHKAVFRAIKSLDDKGDNVDIITVWQEIQRHPPLFAMSVADILSLADRSAVAVDEYARRLASLAKRRRFEMVAAKFRQAAHDETIPIDDLLVSARVDIEELLAANGSQTITITDSIKDVKKIMKDNKDGKSGVSTKTGFSLLDRYGGFHGGDFIVVAGSTSMGKTAFSLSVARNMILNGEPIAYYSMEMQHYQLTARILAMQSGVTSSAILYKSLPVSDTHRIDTATAELVGKSLYYDDKSTMSIDGIIASIRSLHIKHGIKGAFIDYLQITGLAKGMSREESTAKAARDLKNLAKSLGIWVVALSQLSRNNNFDKSDNFPTMDKLRNSGQIAEAADGVILVYRPEYYGADIKFPKPFKEEDTHNRAMIIIPKGRNVGTGSFLCNFIPELTLFTEADTGDLPVISKGDSQDYYHNGNETETNELGDQLPF